MTLRTALVPLALGLFSAATLAPAAQAEERAYAVDAAASELRIDVGKEGLFSGLGHEHKLVAAGVSGRIQLDAAAPARSRVSFEVPAARLAVTDSDLDDEDRATVKRRLDEEVLEVAKFATVAFRSTRVEAVPGKPGELTVKGDLTLHGVTRGIALAVTLRFDGDAVHVEGTARVKQSDFEIDPPSAGLGTVRVADEVTVKFKVVARVAAAGSAR